MHGWYFIDLSEVDVEVLMELITNQDKFQNNLAFTEENLKKLNEWGKSIKTMPKAKRSEFILQKIKEEFDNGNSSIKCLVDAEANEMSEAEKSIMIKKHAQEEADQLQLLKDQIEAESLMLNTEKLRLQKEIKQLEERKQKAAQATPESLKELKENICNVALELNAQKEKNTKDQQEVKELTDLLDSLNSSINFANADFTTNWLDEFDKKFKSETRHNFNAIEVHKSVNELLKKFEKEYDFNIIDPVDEEKDQKELRHQIWQLELQKEQMGPMLYWEDMLTSEDKKRLIKMHDTQDLNEIKYIENRVTKVIKNIDPSYKIDTAGMNKLTIQTSDAFYKKALLKCRNKMIEKRVELVQKETQIQTKTKEFWEGKLKQLEASVLGSDTP